VFAGQKVGVKQVDEHIWLVTFMHDDLGYFETRPAGSNRLIIPSVRNCYPCLRNGPCTEFGISRKTGYKIYDRYKDVGLQGLTDRSRRPYRHANQLPLVIETTIVRLKREYPHWGAPKIRERLRRRCPDVQCPAISTVHAVLDRHGLVTRRKRRRYRAEGTALSQATQPNDLWCADYKGEFMLADRRSATSTTRPAGSSRSRIPSGRKCYPCARNKPSPM